MAIERHYSLDIVIEVSEYNYALGLSAPLPERLPPAVIEKLTYVHTLRSKSLDIQLRIMTRA